MNFCKILKFSRNTCFCYEIARFPLRNIFQYKTRNLLCKSRRIWEYAAETEIKSVISCVLMNIGAEKIFPSNQSGTLNRKEKVPFFCQGRFFKS